MSGTSAGACSALGEQAIGHGPQTAHRLGHVADVAPAEALGPDAVGETVVDAPGDVDGLEQEAVELRARGRGGHWRSASISSSQPSSDWPPPSS